MRNRKGFTLIELMIVVVIIGILAALAIPRFMAASKKAKISEAKGVVKQLWTLSQTYYEEYGYYPVDADFQMTDGAAWNSTAASKLAAQMGFSLPSGKPRFNYYLTDGGGAKAVVNTDVDASLAGVTDVVIDADGNISGGVIP